MTNQRLLGALLIIFIIGASMYFAFTKFKQSVSIESSPSPQPSNLEFMINKNSAPPISDEKQQPQNKQSTSLPEPKPSELPYFRNKYVGKFPGVLTEESLKNKKAVVFTNKGNFEIEIYTDTPVGSSNFMLLASNGFYDGLKFHRLEKGFVIQGGDPLGDGTGGPGYSFQDEAVTKDYKKGVVAYANAGPNTNGSQFFIMLEDHPELPKKYTIFGKIISGMDVVEKLAIGDIMQRVAIQNLQ